VFVNFKSAYDIVWSVKLMDKLQKIGVKFRVLKCFRSFITQHFCATKVENVNKADYDSLREQSQVPPLLMPVQLGEIKNVKSALFADDPVIWPSLPKHQEHQLSGIMKH
jgi:hypothetical protein